MSVQSKPYILQTDEGQAFWFAGALMQLKASGDQTGGQFAFLDQRVPGNYAAPLHIHHAEDEAWYVLEGEVTFFCGEETFAASAGSWVFLPKDIPHAFKVGAAGGRLLTFTAPAEFAKFVAAAGVPAPRLVVPPPEPMDFARLAPIAAQYGIEIVGPPPE
jgi:mannose-6-phosphate isomerase-like protein (cupin superfamily)